MPPRPVVCFALPGGAFTRHYYSAALPGAGLTSQGDWHAARGWIFVSVDPLGVGDSSSHDMMRLGYAALASAADAAERVVLDRLRDGSLIDGMPALASAPLVLGLGQSMGASVTIFQQAHHRSFDGLAVLGFAALDMHIPVRPGEDPFTRPWIPRDALATVLNAEAVAAAGEQDHLAKSMWFFFYDDVDVSEVFPAWAADPARPWISATVPGVILCAQTPGVVFTEAACVDVPVLLGFGERDVCLDKKGEPRAYQSTPSIDFVEIPRMGHMHNFASTRELLWQRIDHWSHWVRTWSSAR
jgi:pimeloyl-ACP methyl ester carboxylesterase